MAKLPTVKHASDLRLGADPYLDAWVLHFLTENNLHHLLNARLNASPEQLRFMVDLDEDQVFTPCSDEMLRELIQPRLTRKLRLSYSVCWRVLVRLTRDIEDKDLQRRVIQFCRHRFRTYLQSHILIPSRLTRRLVSIFLTQTGLEDPQRERKKAMNAYAKAFMDSPAFDRLLNDCQGTPQGCVKLDELRRHIDFLRLKRLFMLATREKLWAAQPRLVGGEAFHEDELREELRGDCPEFDRAAEVLDPAGGPKKILFLPHGAGGVMLDLAACRSLLAMGHRVILALKGGFYFQAPTIADLDSDPVLAKALEGGAYGSPTGGMDTAHVIHQPDISKNELLTQLERHRFLVIDEGARERLNLCRVSTTFARAWKEADLVLAKGEPNYRRLVATDFAFTRDILCVYRDVAEVFRAAFKPRSARVRVFAERELAAMADAIASGMREAKQAGRTVMFYSAVVGSIPGQTKTAVRVLEHYVGHLRRRFPHAHIINPAEHFQEGMDGDDLMFMWERVQRSGLLDVWRFQTYADIEKAFELMGESVPPVWVGKDSTYSTGCTKEMRIALDMQRANPEMQIIGPDPEKFFRRREYGVGKYCDVGLDCD